ncbi:hypothetical protein [Streptomyces sp. NPDC057580]|uniref:hypothetical protein n=1 Tax=Streptomyces sp. NPDC057580 TaxID=3346173 RepID=UPI0036A16BC3
MTEAFVAEFTKVRGKSGLLGKIAEASLKAPDGSVRSVVFPAAGGEKTLKDLVAEMKATNATFARSKREVSPKLHRPGHSVIDSSLPMGQDNSTAAPRRCARGRQEAVGQMALDAVVMRSISLVERQISTVDASVTSSASQMRPARPPVSVTTSTRSPSSATGADTGVTSRYQAEPSDSQSWPRT